MTKSRNIILGLIAFVIVFIVGKNLVGANEKVIHFAFFSESSFSKETENSYLVISEAIEKFERINKDVKVEFTTGILQDDYLDYLNNLILKGETPDVILIPSEDIHTYIELGILEDLDLYGTELSQFYECAVEAGTYENDLYGLPFEIDPTVMGINKDILNLISIEEIDMDWKTTYFYSIASVLEKRKLHPIYNYTWKHATEAYVGSLFNENGTAAYFNDEEVIKAINFVYKLNILDDSSVLGKQDFENGNVAFMPMKYSEYIMYKKYPYSVKNYLNFDLGCVSMPKFEENDTISSIDTTLVAMSKFAKNKELSYEFMEFLTMDQEVQKNLFKYSSGVSPMKMVLNSKEVAYLLNESYDENTAKEDLKVLDYMLLNSFAKPKFAQYEEVTIYADSEITDMIINKKDVDISVKVLQKSMDRLLEK